MHDYFLLSSNVFSLVKSFNILDFNPLYSDVHCALSVYLHMSTNRFTINSTRGHCSKSNYIKWNPAKQNEFVESIFGNEDAFRELDLILGQNCQGNQARDLIDNAVCKIGQIFTETAKSVFGVKKNINMKIRPDNKPWYTKLCHE